MRHCEHVKSNGHFCGSPALRGRNYCFFHLTHIGRQMRAEQLAANPNQDPLALPLLEDAASIQLALMQVTDALLRGTLDPKRAGLVLYALQTASSNLRHMAKESADNANDPIAISTMPSSRTTSSTTTPHSARPKPCPPKLCPAKLCPAKLQPPRSPACTPRPLARALKKPQPSMPRTDRSTTRAFPFPSCSRPGSTIKPRTPSSDTKPCTTSLARIPRAALSPRSTPPPARKSSSVRANHPPPPQHGKRKGRFSNRSDGPVMKGHGFTGRGKNGPATAEADAFTGRGNHDHPVAPAFELLDQQE